MVGLGHSRVSFKDVPRGCRVNLNIFIGFNVGQSRLSVMYICSITNLFSKEEKKEKKNLKFSF